MTLPALHRAAYLVGPERIEIREEPIVLPQAGELLLRVEAATTCGTDLKVFRRGGHPRMLEVPSRFGHELSGSVAAVGEGLDDWRQGDAVALANSAPCGTCTTCRHGRENLCPNLHYLNGAFGEYLLVPRRFVERSVYRRPPGLTAERAAVAEPLACVLHGRQALRLETASDVLLLGCGPIGLLFLQVLVGSGHRVVAADPNADRRQVARQLGAAETMAVERQGSQGAILRRASRDGAGFAVAVEATGSPAAWVDAFDSVCPGGEVLLFGGCALGTMVEVDTHRLHYSEIALKGAYHYRPVSYMLALELLASGRVDPAPLLSGELPLAGLEDALHRMARRQALKVVIRP